MLNSSVVPLEYVLRSLLELHSKHSLEHMRGLLQAGLDTLAFREKLLTTYTRYVCTYAMYECMYMRTATSWT